MTRNKSTVTEQAEYALRDGSNFELQCALKRMLDEHATFIERAAKRIETYALSLELRRHMGLPDPVFAINEAATKLRALV